jgi:hypothetical protein
MRYILLWIITFVEIKPGKENLRNSKNIKNSISGKIEDVITLFYMHAGVLSEAGDIMNFQILLMGKYRTGTHLCRLMEMIQTFYQAFIY